MISTTLYEPDLSDSRLSVSTSMVDFSGVTGVCGVGTSL